VRVRVDETGAESAVRQTHQLLAELLEHEHASLALAQRCSGVAAPTPLFSALLNYRHVTRRRGTHASTRQPGGLTPLAAQERTNYPVSISVDDFGSALSLTAEAREPADPAQLCELMHTALASLATALETTPTRALCALDVLPAAEWTRVVERWNRTAAPYPRDACLHELFETQVAQTPNAVAVVHEPEHGMLRPSFRIGGRRTEVTVTYAELNARADQVARHLRALGVGPEVRVALCLERSVELLVAMIGVLKAGGVYVPLDPEYPAARLRALVADSAPAAVVTMPLAASGRTDGAAAWLAETGLPVLDLSAIPPSLQARAPEPCGVTAANAAYVIYTSGSTGQPKGVVISHEAVVAQLAWVQRAFGLSPSDRVLQFASPTFDVAVEEIFGALLSGAAVVLRTEAWLESADAFWAACARHGVTVVDLPVRFAALVLGDPASPLAPSVRRVVTGGEAVPTSLLAAWCARSEPRPVLMNGYGPTETTISATARVITTEPATWSSIGGPLSNVRTYVLEASGEPVPTGVAGELYIGGVQVARGYWQRPALTAERFVPDPFGPEGSRLYRTGDLARWRADGELEFIGRVDLQVKVRGYRIELGEIEAVLATHERVRHAIVVARDDAAGERQLVAYYVASAKTTANADELHAHLAERLPAYMVPAAYVALDSLPLTASGKVDRNALPAPDGGAYQRRSYDAPVGDVETAIAAFWTELLPVEQVSRWDDFFALGGHSLLAVRFLGRLRQVLGVDVPVGDLFKTPVLAEFARHVASANRAVLPPIPEVVRDPESGVPLEAPPLSYAQQRLWFLEQLGGLRSTYHM
ncbi:MAG: non-ribosomal peptide synthetase, partial [Gemmatimonadaceae bacterium]